MWRVKLNLVAFWGLTAVYFEEYFYSEKRTAAILKASKFTKEIVKTGYRIVKQEAHITDMRS